MKSNVLSAFIVRHKDMEYLCADCDYSYMGVDAAVYAKRKIEEDEWQHIDVFEHDKKQPCATIYVFGNSYEYLKNKTEISLKEFHDVITKLEIKA